MKELAELMEKCRPCGGTGQVQFNEPFKLETCGRCHGDGRERPVQVMRGLHVLTSNGRIFQQGTNGGWVEHK